MIQLTCPAFGKVRLTYPYKRGGKLIRILKSDNCGGLETNLVGDAPGASGDSFGGPQGAIPHLLE